MDCFSCFKYVGQKKSDYGCGFFLFGCLRQLFNVLCLFLVFSLGLKVLQLGNHLKGLIQLLFDFRGKSTNGFCSKGCTDHGKHKTINSCGFRGKSSDLGNGFCSKPCGLLESLRNSEPIAQLDENNGVEKTNCDCMKENLVSNGEFCELPNWNGNVEENFDPHGESGDESEGHDLVNEDEEVDVMALRELVKIERQRADAAYLELEKERTAAVTASEEAMAMILRLQNDKSLIKMEAKQYRRLAEEKQTHDQEVIQSLKWIVMKHESERSLLEDQLRCFTRRSKVCVEGDEGDESASLGFDESLNLFNSNMKESTCDSLISSRDIDMSPRCIFGKA